MRGGLSCVANSLQYGNLSGEIIIAMNHSEGFAVRRQRPEISEVEFATALRDTRFNQQFRPSPRKLAAPGNAEHKILYLLTGRFSSELEAVFAAVRCGHEHLDGNGRLSVPNPRPNFRRLRSDEFGPGQIGLPDSGEVRAHRESSMMEVALQV